MFLQGCFSQDVGDKILGINRPQETSTQVPDKPKEAFYTKEARYHTSLADKLAAQGSYEEALELYEKAIKTDPNYYPALKAMGVMYEKQGNLDLAEKYYRETIVINAKDPALLYKLGNIASLKDNYDDAIQYYDKAINQVPDFFEAYRNKGLIHKIKNQPDQALEAYQKARGINPDDKKNLLNIGNIYAAKCPKDTGFAGFFKKGYCENAQEAYNKAIGIDKKYVNAYINLAYLYLETGQREQAKKTISKGLEIAPENSKLRSLLEEIKMKLPK